MSVLNAMLDTLTFNDELQVAAPFLAVEMIMFIGLMGIKNDGTLVTPSGIELFKLPIWLGSKIQKLQHWLAKKTWR